MLLLRGIIKVCKIKESTNITFQESVRYIQSNITVTVCYILDQQLHVVHLEPAPREKCEEVSEVSPHTICTQEKSERSECNVS